MARCTDTHASGARASRRALLALATVGCCALVPQSAPVALAAKSTTTSASPAPIEAPGSSRSRRAERAASVEAAPVPAVVSQPPATPEAPAGGHGRHAPLSNASPPSPTSVSGASARHAGAGSGSQHVAGSQPGASAHARANSAHGTSGANDTSEGVAAAGVAPSDQSAQSIEALARQKKGSGGEKGGGKKQKEKAKGKGKGTEAEGESSTPVESETVKRAGVGSGAKLKDDSPAVETQTPATAAGVSAASATAPVASPSSGSDVASIVSAAPSASAAARRGAGAKRSHRGARKGDGSGATAASGTLAAAVVLPAVLGTSASSPSPRAAHAAAPRTHTRSTQPALVKTITKIVGVVPAPVRILIGALIALALALGLRSLVASIRTRRLVRQRGELLEDVGLLQAALLPEPPARLGPVGTSVAYRPADGPGAGGDFYDVFALADGRLAVIVGDVSGHGREALPHTALVRFTVRAYLEAGLAPAEALQTAGVVLERQLAGSFATVIAAIYHPRERTLTYASAGHPPPVVLGEPAVDGTFTRAATVTSLSAPPIGVESRTGTRQTVVAVPGSARVCFHTDGVTEARVGGDLFGSERLARIVAGLDEDAGAASLLDSVAAQSDARPDDMAACLLQIHGGAGAPAIVSERVELDGESIERGRLERFLHDSGVGPAQIATLLDAARAELARAGRALLELRFEDGAPIASVRADNVIPAEPLAVARAS
ncbi:MAG TPA: SpoIIE family protein phosphatase [Solirubrobacteraceae bacterium]|nr:SpoIIE family protein phosphatase [Solirubrobacteraceae bacterium]